MLQYKNKYFIDSELMLIISPRPWEILYIELFELCKTSKSRHLHTIPIYLRHVFVRSEIMNIISLLQELLCKSIKSRYNSVKKRMGLISTKISPIQRFATGHITIK